MTNKDTMGKMLKASFAYHEAGNKFIEECLQISLKSGLNSFFIISLVEAEINRLKSSFDKAKEFIKE